jgi:hypothetical protein
MSWEDLPEEGFQIFVLFKDNGVAKIVSGCDYYWLEADIRTDCVPTMPHPTERHALVPSMTHSRRLEYLQFQHPHASLKWGLWMPDEEFRAVQALAIASVDAYHGEGVKWR